jgi:hypothetical protein
MIRLTGGSFGSVARKRLKGSGGKELEENEAKG